LKMKKMRFFVLLMATLLAVASFTGCSTMINNAVANALTGGGAAAVFTEDSDPELVRGALPFAIKMYEALLFSTPRHQGLMLTTGSLFIMYANAFVHTPADMLPFCEWEAQQEGWARARQLYLRGHSILLDALEQRHRGFTAAAQNEDDMRVFAQRFRSRDVPVLYWAVAGGLAAFSLEVLDSELAMQIPVWRIMIERAFELDPDFSGLDELLLLYFASVPEAHGGNRERARYHFERAMERSGGNSTGALISYARSISVPEQDFDTFEERLERVLAINPDDNPSTRLITILDQRRARWLLYNAEDFFLFYDFYDY